MRVFACVTAALLLLAAVALAVACGGGSDSDGSLPDLSAEEYLERAGTALAEVDSFRLALEGTASIVPTEDGGLEELSGLVSGALDVEGAGPVVRDEGFSIDLTAQAGLPLQVNLTRSGDELFVRVLGQDFRLELDERTVQALDLGELFPSLAGWITDPEVVGSDEIDGVTTARLEGSIDGERAARELEAVLSGGADVSVDPEALSDALSDGTVTVWVGADDFVPRRVDAAVEASDGVAEAGLERVSIDVSASISDIGGDFTIAPPDAARSLSLDDLTELVPGP